MNHGSTSRRILYDVEGSILASPQGRLYNIYCADFHAALETKAVRLFRNSTMGAVCYRYFVTSTDQLAQFLEDRRYGSTEGPNKRYHVYLDDDGQIPSGLDIVNSRELSPQ